MTKDDYLRIAREIWGPYLGMSDGYTDGVGYSTSYSSVDLTAQMYSFASTIAALEREECARLVDDSMFEFTLKAGITKDDLLAAIRNKEK